VTSTIEETFEKKNLCNQEFATSFSRNGFFTALLDRFLKNRLFENLPNIVVKKTLLEPLVTKLQMLHCNELDYLKI